MSNCNARQRTLDELLDTFNTEQKYAIGSRLAQAQETITDYRNRNRDLENKVNILTELLIQQGHLLIRDREDMNRNEMYDTYNRVFSNIVGLDNVNKWRPIECYFQERKQHDWVLVQFVEKGTGFMGLPYIVEWRELDNGIKGWFTHDESGMFNYLNNMCVAIGFFEWKQCDLCYDSEKCCEEVGHE